MFKYNSDHTNVNHYIKHYFNNGIGNKKREATPGLTVSSVDLIQFSNFINTIRL